MSIFRGTTATTWFQALVCCCVTADNLSGFYYENIESRLNAIQAFERDLLTYTNHTVQQLKLMTPLLSKLQLAPQQQATTSSSSPPSSSLSSVQINGGTLAASCREVPATTSGIYRIDPNYPFQEPMAVYCEQSYEGGGWTVIQRRMDGSVNFMRDWQEYKRGFGTLRGEFWLGLDQIHRLTNVARHELVVLLEDFDGGRATARYDHFRIGAESVNYGLLELGRCVSCSAGDSLDIHLNESFSTYDRDNSKALFNCAAKFGGAWWFYRCHKSNLNGEYLRGKLPESQDSKGVMWNSFRGSLYSLKSSKMMIRPVGKR
ncbi:ficolin-2-like [Anopheles aquasalis]|uniref:ficolin-2-like n=1 Tax=Anopheles aquasalis TaxID=42839 RepID=UPI00215AE9FB|nr:ficolin-2-like [Anopheles aquasalis]